MVTVPRFAHVPEDQVRSKSDVAAVEAGCTWHPDRGQRFCDFVERYIVPTRGPSADRTVTLLDWQRDAAMRLFSWAKPNGFRRFRSGCLFIPRQNGKSFFASCLSLYMLMADKEPGAYVSVSACTSEQTKIVFGEVSNSVKSSPVLMECCVLRESVNEIFYPKTNSRLKGLSSEGWGKLGNPPHLAVMDEFCFWANYKPYEALKTGMDSRNQPLLFAISTSGTDRSTQGHETWKYAEAVAQSLITDTAFCPFVYAAAAEDDIQSEDTWRKCNPSLGVTVPVEETRQWAARAKTSKVEELQFRQYRLNQWTTSVNQFLDLDAWHACSQATWPDLNGKPAYLGVDLSCTTDLTSVVAVIPHNGCYYVNHHSFCCKVGVERREAQNLVKYGVFEAEGVMTVHDGNCVDYDLVRGHIRKLCKQYKVQSIAFDPTRNAADTMIMLQNEGLPVTQYGQGPLYFNAPMTRLSELVLDRKICHRGDSLICWQAQNLEAKRDSRDMIGPHKPSAEAKIDTLVATIMALAKAIEGAAVLQSRPKPGKIEWW